MSNYRDDSQDTAIASSKTFGGLRAVVDEVLRLADALLFGIAITMSASALASDEVIDNSIYSFHDSAHITDELIGSKSLALTITDSSKIADQLTYGLAFTEVDSITISDKLINGSTAAISRDSAAISDEVTSQRIVSSVVADSASISDSLTAIERDSVTASAGVLDSVLDRLHAVQLIADSVQAQDEQVSSTIVVINDSAAAYDQVFAKRNVVSMVSDSVKAADNLLFNRMEVLTDSAVADSLIAGKLNARGVIIDSGTIDDIVIDNIIQSVTITDSALIADSVIDKLDTAVLIIDGAVIEDITIDSGGLQGQAWTANVDSWAMSRYNPYNYNRLVVINDVLYGEADDGIYQLNQEVYPVVASVKTGKMDLGNGQMTHPAYAYLEYELDGNASMIVSSTQKGVEQQFTYVLPNELASELTNGRFVFGRGLRGRHFSFELIMVGTHGHINDLSIEHAPTSRRV